MGDGVSFSFNKGNKFNITTSDGVSKEELIQRAGGENTQQGKLISSIFARYDNGDGFLSADEYQAMQADLVRFAKDDNLGGRELKKFNSNLSTEGNAVEGNAYSMEDLQAVISMMVDGSDNVTGVVQDGDNLKVTYKPEEGVGTRTSTFAKGDNNALTLLSDSVVNVDTITVTEYVNGDKTKKSKTVETVTNGFETTTIYADDGTTPTSIVKVKGIETYQMDPEHPERPLEYVKNGQPQKETVKYTYNNEGSVETTYLGDSNKPSKVVTKDAQGNVVSTKTYTYTDGQSTELEVTGTGDAEVRVRTQRQGNKIIGQVNVDAENNVQDATHQVKPGETWYNIVQAKYGVTDPKTIMQIVHKLKDNAGIGYSENRIPRELTLPGTIDLGGGKTVNLKNTGALVSIDGCVDTNGRQIGPRITPPQALAAADIPQPIAALTADQQQITIPTFEVKPENARKFVRQDNGQYYYYNEDGRVTDIYADENAKNARNTSVYIKYNDQGAVTTYQQNTHDAQGHWTGSIQYDGSGAFANRWVNDQFDPEHPKQYGRQTNYNADGTISSILDNFQYDDQDRELSYDNFKADGSWSCSRRMDYGNDGACQVRYYGSADRGRMTQIEK